MTSIFVAKLDFNVTDNELKSLFEQHGKVSRVTIAKDKETGKPRGFAFVEMFDESEAQQAIDSLDNFAINGRNIAVKKADDRNAGSKPQGGADNKFKERPSFKSNDQPRKTFDNNSSSFTERTARESFDNQGSVKEQNDFQPKVVDRKKDKEKEKRSGDNPKKTKMSAYKKSGKSDRFVDDDEDDDDLDFYYNRNRAESWDDDDEEED